MNEIAIVGAGLAGLTAALRLAEAGYRVRVFERYPRPGGLARALEIGGEPLEAFYHHIFTTDTDYIALAEELGLKAELEWLPSKMGIWADGRLWEFGTPASLLRFKPMRLIDKLRFGLSTLWLQRRKDPLPYEGVTAAEWIRRHQGERTWRSVWGPLLYQKFADDADKVAMVWLWRKISLRGGSRSKSGMGERLGYMRGSFIRLVEVLAERIESAGASLHLTEEVRRIDTDDDGLSITTRRETYRASKILVAAPIPDHLAVAGHLLAKGERAALGRLRATGAVCTILELDRSLTSFYWLNIADPEMPFGGLIEHTNFIPAERYGGRTLLYISNYLFTDHPLYRAPKSEIIDAYLPHLQRINPRFEASWIRKSHHFRADYAQPVVTTGYRERIPAMRTSVPGLYLCSMAQIFPEDRGQNYAIAYGDKVAKLMLEDLGGGGG
jgi:protoporphyrinogen oxidase